MKYALLDKLNSDYKLVTLKALLLFESTVCQIAHITNNIAKSSRLNFYLFYC